MKSIAQVSAFYGISSRTLRFYEEAGLIASHRNPDSRYRAYDEGQCRRLEVVLLLRRLSFGVKEIARLLDGNDESLRALIRDKMDAANRQRLEAQEIARLLGDVLTALNHAPLSELSVDDLLSSYIYRNSKTERMVRVHKNEEATYVLTVGTALIPYVVGEAAPNNIFGMITQLRDEIKKEGKQLPPIRIIDNIHNQPAEAVLYNNEETEIWREIFDVTTTSHETFGRVMVTVLRERM